MTSAAPTITLDLVIEMLTDVMKESAPREARRVDPAGWDRETLLDDTGFNSYHFVELVFQIEDRFGIEIDYNANDGLNDVKTLGQLRDEIGKLVSKKPAA